MNTNYFELFDLSPTFSLDKAKLSARYHALQIEHHPDKVAGGQEDEKMQAVQMASLLNGAYETLVEPLSRAGYLLTLSGIDIEKVTQSDLGMELLMEQMELRESLAELPKDEASLTELDALKAQVNRKIEAREQKFVDCFEGDNLDGAKKVFHEMQFLSKLLLEINAGEELRLGY